MLTLYVFYPLYNSVYRLGFRSMQSVLHSCLSTRVVLHLREIDLTVIQTSELGPVSDIVFGRNSAGFSSSDETSRLSVEAVTVPTSTVE